MPIAVEDYETALNVMFRGVLYPTLAVLPQMRVGHRGRSVNVTSIGGMVSVPYLLPYNCTKFGAVCLSEGLRAELGQAGIHVTTMFPGLMRTGSHLRAAFAGSKNVSSPGLPWVPRCHAYRYVQSVWHGRSCINVRLLLHPQALARTSGSSSLLWSNVTDARYYTEPCPGAVCGCLGVCASLDTAVGPRGPARAAPARPISRRACGYVCPVSHAAQCPRRA